MEPEEGLEKVEEALRVCRSYKDIYNDRREELYTYFKTGQQVMLWGFQSSLVFARFNEFMSKLSVVEVNLVCVSECCIL